MINKRDILIILSLFFVAILIRAVNLSKVCMTGDEWLYWNNVNRILASNFAPTAEVFEYASPFFPYIGAGLTLLIEGKLDVLRMISVVFGSFTVPMMYLFGKAMYDRKTGLISAILLCFSAYHCLYSRLFMFEAFTLFFITAFLYFFWLSQCSENRKRTTYAIIAGAMMGLAFDAKYISAFLIPALLAYVLWSSRFNFKALFDKRIILIFIFAFLFITPLLICWYYTDLGLDPLFYYFEKVTAEKAVGTQVSGFSPDYLVLKGVEALDRVLTWGSDFLSPMWTVLFKLSAFLLFIITFFSYLPGFLRKEKKSSFLLISVSTLYIFYFVVCAGYTHYLIYSFPFYFVMLSHLAVKSFEHLRRGNSGKDIFRIFIVLLVAIMLLTTCITGATSPYWNEGNASWVKSSLDYIKSDVSMCGYEKQIVIGTFLFTDQNLDYHAYLINLNATTLHLLGPWSANVEKIRITSLKMIDILKPDYIIMQIHIASFYTRCFKGEIKKEILEDYRIVFQSQTYPYPCIVLKRRNILPSELVLPANSTEGKISQDVFKRSVPSTMKVGKVYTALVQVKNTGDSRMNFVIRVHSEKFIIFVGEGLREITLDKGSTRTLKFKIVPISEYVGELPITAELYPMPEDGIIKEKIESVSDFVYLIH